MARNYEKIYAPEIKPTLGLLGATVNAMALIAPGAFLWITYQLQCAATAPNGLSVASDIWAGIVLALMVAFLTAFSYAELANCILRQVLPVAATLLKRPLWIARASNIRHLFPWPGLPNS